MDRVTKTAAEVAEFYKENFPEKRAMRAQVSNTNIPLKGIFADVDAAVYNNGKEEIKYPVLIVVDKDGNKIGTLAVSSVFQRKALPRVNRVGSTNSQYAGKYFVAGEFINPFCNGKEVEVLADLFGKPYTAKMQEMLVPKVDIVDGVCKHFKDTEEEALKQVENKNCLLINLGAN